MLNRKLLEILQRLQPAEIKKLRLFLQSPYFTYGISKDILSLFDLIIRHGADGMLPALDKKRLSKRFFPDKPYLENKKNPIDNLASSLLTLTKKFLFIQSAEENTSAMMKELAVARFYMKFGLEERFLASEQLMRQLLDQQKMEGASLFLEKYFLEELATDYNALFSDLEKHATTQVLKMNALDHFFSVAKLELLCHLMHLKQMTKLDLPQPDTQITALLNHLSGEENTAANLYRKVLNAFQNLEDFSQVQIFEDYLKAVEHLIAPEHRQNCASFLRNFYMKWFQRTGQAEHFKAYFQLTIQHLEAGYLYHEGKIFSFSLRNIIITGLRIGEYDIVLKILENHPPERIGGTLHPKEVYHLNLAFYYFALKNYERAEQYLTYCDYKNILLSIQAEITRIKIFYETGSPLLEPRVKALLQKVRRAGIAKQYQERYAELLNKILLLVKYGWDKNNPKRAQLADSIRKTPGALEKEWLLSHLE
jgi:hypothetical protein